MSKQLHQLGQNDIFAYRFSASFDPPSGMIMTHISRATPLNSNHPSATPSTTSTLGAQGSLSPVSKAPETTATPQSSRSLRAPHNRPPHLNKVERAEAEHKISKGSIIPGTENVIMDKRNVVFQAITLPTIHCQKRTHSNPKPLQVNVPYRALAHIASAPNRINHIQKKTGLRSIESWIASLLKGITSCSEPWTLHRCPETQRQILTIFHNNESPPSFASQLILTAKNPAQLITGYFIDSEHQWSKAGASLAGSPLVLEACFGSDQLSTTHQTQFGLDAALSNPNNLENAQPDTQLKNTSLANTENQQESAALEPTPEFKMEPKNTLDLQALLQLQDNVLSKVSYFESAIIDYAQQTLQFSETRQHILSLIPGANPNYPLHIDTRTGFQLEMGMHVLNIKDLIAALLAQPLLIEEHQHDFKAALAEFETAVIDGNLDTLDSLVENAAELKKIESALCQQTNDIKKELCDEWRDFLCSQQTNINKFEHILKYMSGVSESGQQILKSMQHLSLSSNALKNALEYNKREFIGLALELITDFDPREISPEFNIECLKRTLKALDSPTIDGKKLIKEMDALTDNIESLIPAIVGIAASHQEDFGAMLKWTNAFIQEQNLDKGTQLQRLMPLIRLAGTLGRSNKSLLNIESHGKEFSQPKNRKRGMQFKRLVDERVNEELLETTKLPLVAKVAL